MKAFLPMLALTFGCQADPETTPPDTTTETDTTPLLTVPDETITFPLPEDLDTIPFDAVYADALASLTKISTQMAWQGHTGTLADGDVTCPALWTGEFTDADATVGDEDGVAWNDACTSYSGDSFDGWMWWDTAIQAVGSLADEAGLSVDAARDLEGDSLVLLEGDIRFLFSGEASDSLSTVTTQESHTAIYSSTLDATLDGLDALGEELVNMPSGFRTDLFTSMVTGPAPYYEARGNVYFFEPTLHGRFDSIAIDVAFPGPGRAGPDDCALEPRGWIGVRDTDAYWYDIVFLPRNQDDALNEDENADIAAACDGCGQLFVHGLAMPDIEVCPDFTALFDGSILLPDSADYALPIH